MESLVVEGIVSNLEMDGKTRVSVASMENGVLYDGGVSGRRQHKADKSGRHRPELVVRHAQDR
jgi:hypothetical protein